MTPDDYQRSLSIEQRRKRHPYWRMVHGRLYPDICDWELLEDRHSQNCGHDRALFLPDRTVFVEEKVEEQDFLPGIALEDWQDEPMQKPGWMRRRLTADELVIWKLPKGLAYAINFPQLQAAWDRYYARWLEMALADGCDWRYPPTTDTWKDGKLQKTRNLIIPARELVNCKVEYRVIGLPRLTREEAGWN